MAPQEAVIVCSIFKGGVTNPICRVYMEYMLILQADNCTGNNDLIFLLLQPFPFGGELFSEHDHLLYPQLSVSR